MALDVQAGRALAPLTTLGLGGPAAHYVEVDTRAALADALAWAAARRLPVAILGGGSNVVVADAGFPGLVLSMRLRGLELTRGERDALLCVQAGECWDDVVELSVREGLAGIECLSGIPGLSGATPIQNVGAYGQEVSDVLEAVEVFDRSSGSSTWLSAEQCAFGYRDSRFKREPARFVVLALRMRLRSDGVPTLRYGELARALEAEQRAPTLRATLEVVRSLRAKKGMLVTDGWEPSAGSFFMNPIVSREQAAQVVERALASGCAASEAEVVRFPHAGERVKLAAAWLIERAGIARGTSRGAVGVSTRHALALVHRGGGTTAELLGLAAEIRDRVESVFGVRLQIEPVLWGAADEQAPKAG